MKVTLFDSYYPGLESLKEWYYEALDEALENDIDLDKDEFLHDCWYRDLEFTHDDLIAQLNIKGDYVIIADLGLWHGRRFGYKLIDNMKDFFYSSCDYVKIYTDNHNLLFDGSHHDGNNHYILREFKSDLSDTQRDNFLDKIYNGEATKKDITRYTKSVKNEVLKGLGWI